MKQAKQQGKNQCFLQVSNMHTYTLQLTQNILSSDQFLSQKRCIGFVKIWFRCQIFQNKKSKPKKVILAKVDFIKHFTRKIVPPYGEQLYSGFVQNLKLRCMKFWKLLNKILIFDTSRLRVAADQRHGAPWRQYPAQRRWERHCRHGQNRRPWRQCRPQRPCAGYCHCDSRQNRDGSTGHSVAGFCTVNAAYRDGNAGFSYADFGTVMRPGR